jgi:CBS domain-containing protein
VSGDQIWPILLGISVVLNLLLLLRRPILSWLHRDKGEELASEIMAMVEEGEESGAIEQNEKELIENIFEFNSMTADDVMIHRTDMVTLPLRADDSTILSTIQSSGLSRFPVYNEDIDDIVGILSTRDYLLNSRQKQPLPLEKLLRPAYFVPESVRADVLFRDMQNRKIHMALVVDEYGGTGGLLTLEDLLEELVGKIYDEFDPQEEQDIIRVNNTQWPVPPIWRIWPKPWGWSCRRTSWRSWTVTPWAVWSLPCCPSFRRTAAALWWRPWGSGSGWRSCGTAGWSGPWPRKQSPPTGKMTEYPQGWGRPLCGPIPLSFCAAPISARRFKSGSFRRSHDPGHFL